MVALPKSTLSQQGGSRRHIAQARGPRATRMHGSLAPLIVAANSAAVSRVRPAGAPLVVHFVRHGQATHNVRAEVRREEGCSHAEFIAAMQADDELDAELTDIGREQARAAAVTASWTARKDAATSIQLVVCSPLSRAIETAGLVFREEAARGIPFVSNELLREWNGLMLNARRRPRAELMARFPSVDFSQIPEDEEAWTPTLEPASEVAQRGLRFLDWLAQRPEWEVAVVAHGGIYSSLFTHASVRDESKLLSARFGNCDCRSVEMLTHPHSDVPEGVFAFRALG